MGFEFNYTCREIDKNIERAEDLIKDHVSDLIIELRPDLGISEVEKLEDSFTKELYTHLTSIFEEVRETNEKMRFSAEEQIESLEELNEQLLIDKIELEEQLETAQELLDELGQP